MDISIKERADAIKEGSSAYNYYMNTPLSELNSRDDKLLKKELEKRSLKILSESDDDDIESDEELENDVDNAIDTAEEENAAEEEGSTWKDKLKTGALVAGGLAAAGGAAYGGYKAYNSYDWKTVYDSFRTWVRQDVIGKTVNWLRNGAEADKEASAAQLRKNGINYRVKKLANIDRANQLASLSRLKYGESGDEFISSPSIYDDEKWHEYARNAYTRLKNIYDKNPSHINDELTYDLNDYDHFADLLKYNKIVNPDKLTYADLISLKPIGLYDDTMYALRKDKEAYHYKESGTPSSSSALVDNSLANSDDLERQRTENYHRAEEARREKIQGEAPLSTWWDRNIANTSLYMSGERMINSWASYVDKKIVDIQNKYNEWFPGKDENGNPNTPVQTEYNPANPPSTTGLAIVWTIIVAIIIIAIYGIWKLIRWFVKDNGTEKNEEQIEEMQENPEEATIAEGLEYNFYTNKVEAITEMENPFSSKYNPLYNNMPLAILMESDDPKVAEDASNRFSVKIAIKLSGRLSNDSKFINYMSKVSPVLLEAVQQYSNVAKPEAVQEALLYEADETPALPETTEVDEDTSESRGFLGRTWDSIKAGFGKLGVFISDASGAIKDKIMKLYFNLDDGSIKWIPTIVTTAIAILGGIAAYRLNKYGSILAPDLDYKQLGKEAEEQVAKERADKYQTFKKGLEYGREADSLVQSGLRFPMHDSSGESEQIVDYQQNKQDFINKDLNPNISYPYSNLHRYLDDEASNLKFLETDPEKATSIIKNWRNLVRRNPEELNRIKMYDFYKDMPDREKFILDNLYDAAKGYSATQSIKLASSDLQYFINESINALTIFNEAVQTNAKNNKDPFEGLSGKGEKLAHAIVDKAYRVSIETMNDQDCVMFFKKNNPEFLKTMDRYVKKDYKASKK